MKDQINQNGISTGFSELDKLILNFRPGQLITIAGHSSSEQFKLANHFAASAKEQTEWPVIVFSLSETPLRLDEIIAISKSKKCAGNLGMIVVDYLQLIKTNISVSQISRSLKILAKEVLCPVVLISQLNSEFSLAELSNAGDGTADADIIIFIVPNPNLGHIKIMVVKNRAGNVGKIQINQSLLS